MHLIIMMAAIAIGLDWISIGIISSIAIGLDWILIGVNGGFDAGFDGGSSINSTWPCWAINLSKAFNSSDKRLLQLSAERILWAIIIVI